MKLTVARARKSGAIAVVYFVVARLIVLLGMLVARAILPNGKALSDIALAWDGARYLGVARHWYPDQIFGANPDGVLGQAGFFPGYPLVAKAVDWFLPIGLLKSALLVSFVSGAIATWFVWKIAKHLRDDHAADRAAILFALFPGTVVFSWCYPEALASAGVAGAIYYLLKKRFITAGLFGLVATASKPTAALLLIAFGFVLIDAVIKRRQRIRVALSMVLASAGVVFYFLYLWIHTGVYNAWFRVEREIWTENLNFGTKVWDTVGDYLTGARTDFSALFTTMFLVIGIGLIAVTLFTRTALWEKIFVLLVVFSSLNAVLAPMSLRAQVVAIPAFVAAGIKLSDRTVFVLVGCSAALLLLLTIAYGAQLLPPVVMWAV